jgi:hypothetical protein
MNLFMYKGIQTYIYIYIYICIYKTYKYMYTVTCIDAVENILMQSTNLPLYI